MDAREERVLHLNSTHGGFSGEGENNEKRRGKTNDADVTSESPNIADHAGRVKGLSVRGGGRVFGVISLSLSSARFSTQETLDLERKTKMKKITNAPGHRCKLILGPTTKKMKCLSGDFTSIRRCRGGEGNGRTASLSATEGSLD